jgi:hypothetical protein
MKFSVYGGFQIDVQREHGALVAFRVELGKRAKGKDFVIPLDLEPQEIAT